jgi:D-sedoheptulose 7-phosphate isomerase
MEPTSRDDREHVRAHLLTSADVKRRVAETCLDEILAAVERITTALQTGHKLMLCGNGGSAADAQHLAAEFTNRMRADLQRPAMAALALTTDTSFLTSNANDYGFEYVFERQIEGLGHPGDVLMGISTSGNSRNVIRAVQCCRNRQIQTIGLLGGAGGKLRSLVDLAILVPSSSTQHIQEAHITIGHVVSELVEQRLFGNPSNTQ